MSAGAAAAVARLTGERLAAADAAGLNARHIAEMALIALGRADGAETARRASLHRRPFSR